MKEFINSLIKPLLYEQDTKSVGIFGGSFKPPTKGHLEVVQTALQQYPNLDEFYIVVGSGVRDGITQEESLRVWEIYKKFLPSNVKIVGVKSPFSWIKIIVLNYHRNYLFLPKTKINTCKRFLSNK